MAVSVDGQFGVCLVEAMGGGVGVEVHLRDGCMRVEKGGPLRLFHSPDCPLQGRGKVQGTRDDMSAAVCVLVSHQGRVLVTRRHHAMRSFPCVWVLPGGAVDAGETLETAALREVEEETGLELPVGCLDALCVYESVYPVSPLETPSHHHVILYFRGEIPDDQDVAIVPSPNEVDAWVWLERHEAAQLVSEDPVPADMVIPASPNAVSMSTLQGLKVDGVYPIERLSTGTKFALKAWLSVEDT